MTETKSKFFYGWLIVAVALLALVVSNGLAIGGIPVFYKVVQTDLVSEGAIATGKAQSVYGIAAALTFLLSGLLAPAGAFLLQKFNARTMMLAGCLILGAGLIVYSQAHSPLLIYLAHALLGASLGFVGVLTSVVLVSNWFEKKRGLALGIVLTGTSFGGVIIPQIATPLIANYGWRIAMIGVSLIIWLILLPAVVLLVKNRPSDLGLSPDGETTNESSAEQSKTQHLTPKPQNLPPNTGFTLTEAMGTPAFWILSLCAAFVFYAFFVVSQQLNLYLQGAKLNFTPAQASFAQSLLFFCSIAGKFTFGWLADKFSASRVMLASAALMFLSTLFFLYFNAQTAYLFAVLFGLNYGGTFVLLQLLVVEYFGLKEYGKILGALTVIETIGGAMGTFVTGKIADASGGDYTQAFYAVIAAAALALLMISLLNLSLAKLRRPLRLLPVIISPIVGAFVGVIAAPVFSEIYQTIAGAEISLTMPLVIICLLIGLVIGISAGKKLQLKLANDRGLLSSFDLDGIRSTD